MNVCQCFEKNGDGFELITKHESDESSYCMICVEPVNGLSVFRHELYSDPVIPKPFVFHKSCGELPGKINHPLHPHSLEISDFPESLMIRNFTCDVCFTFSYTFKYHCKICDEKVCYPCISKYVEGQELRQKVEKFTPYHPHKLQVIYFHQNRFPPCVCCLKSVRDFGYFCLRCELFYSHVSCISDIPEEIISSFHPEHSLNFEHILSLTKCTACPRKLNQVKLGCSICNCSFHVSCGQYTSPGLRVNEDVTLFYINDCFDDEGLEDDDYGLEDEYRCGICDEKILQAPMYRLLGSIKNFHVECLLPPTLNHPCHYHPLTLSSSVKRKTEVEKYRCDVCEEEEDFEPYAYQCMECDFNAHMECLFAEEDKPFLIEFSQAKDISIEEEEEEGTKDKVVSNKEDGQENETGEEVEKSNLESSNLLEWREKMIGLTQEIKQLYGKVDKLTEELNQVKLIYETKSNELNITPNSLAI